MWIPNPLASRSGRLAAFFCLYVTEGIPFGFSATAVVTHLRRQGLGPAEIGWFTGLLYLPWSWKLLIAPAVDLAYSRRMGRRRGWILITQALIIVGLLGLMPVNLASQWHLLTWIVLAINVCSATQDIAIDALACGVLREEERGLANGLMFAGAYVGQAIGGAGVLMLSDSIGIKAAVPLIAGCVLTVMALVSWPLREPPAPSARSEQALLRDIRTEVGAYLRRAWRAFAGTGPTRAGLLFALLPAGAYALSLALASNISVELGLSDGQIGRLTLACSVVSAISCVGGGYLSDRLGRRRMLALFIVGTAVPTLWLAGAMHEHGWIFPGGSAAGPAPGRLVVVLWLTSLLYSAFQGLLYGTRTALFMDLCSPAVAATQFTAYMSLLNLVNGYTPVWQGRVAARWGYPAALALDAVVGLICLLPLIAMKPTRARVG